MLSSHLHLGLLSYLFSSGSPAKAYTHFSCPPHTQQVRPILGYLIGRPDDQEKLVCGIAIAGMCLHTYATYLLSYSMDRSPSESIRLSSSQEIPTLYMCKTNLNHKLKTATEMAVKCVLVSFVGVQHNWLCVVRLKCDAIHWNKHVLKAICTRLYEGERNAFLSTM
jgi:hypothetical protein